MLGRLGDLAQTVGTARDLVTVYRALRDYAVATTGSNGIFVSHYDPERNERTAVYAWTEGAEVDVSTLPPMPMSDSPHSRAVATGEIVVHDDLQQVLAAVPHVDVGMDVDPRVPQSSLAAPMIAGGRTIGGFEVQSVRAAAYTAGHVAAMRLAANLAAIATENVRLFERERQQRRMAQASEARAQELIQGLDAIVFELDPTRDAVSFVSRQVAPILGRDPEQLMGPLDRLLGLIHADDRDDVRARFRAVIAQGGDADMEVRATRPDRRVVWLHLVVRLTRDDAGAPRVRGVAVDVSERRRLEERLLGAQKMEAIGQLAGGIAHDFNNILTAIRGSAQLLRADLAAGDPRREDAEAIEDAADRGATLVRQLLAFGRRQRLQPTVVDLNELLADITPMLQRLMGSNVRLRAVAAEDLGRVLADPGQLQQVVLNLVVNARDAMPHGGDLTIETSNVELDARYARRHPEVIPGPYVVLAVSDQGVGIDPEDLPRIFEPFFTTKTGGESSGLGLATVYGIVKQSGGHIDVFSDPAHGTTFRVYFPYRAERPEARPVVAASAPERGSGTILLVEDDDRVRALTARMLKGVGYEVIIEHSGIEAIARLERGSESIDLVLSDVVMPGMQGPELIARAREIRPGIGVLLFSGYAGPARGAAATGPADDAVRILQKPFTAAALARAIREALASER